MLMKVLVADPNPLVRDVVKLALVPAGWEVELVADGVSALAYLNEAKSPVIAYLSTELTGTTALSLIQKFSQRDAERGVFPVLMSLRCDPKVVVEALSAGAMDFLFLPTEPEVIRAKAEVNYKVMRRLEGAGAGGAGEVEVEVVEVEVRSVVEWDVVVVDWAWRRGWSRGIPSGGGRTRRGLPRRGGRWWRGV